jgi:hypothetical protein
VGGKRWLVSLLLLDRITRGFLQKSRVGRLGAIV